MKFWQAAMILLLVHGIVEGQTFKVTEVKKCSYIDGRRIKKGDTLSLQDKFSISRNGLIRISYLDQWGLSRDYPGNYSVDTIFSNLKRNKEFRKIDSIYQVLKTYRILNCNFAYKYTSHTKRLTDGSLVKWTETDNIKIKNDQNDDTTSSSYLIEWEYPTEYHGKYFILITDLFDGFIDLLNTNDKFIELDLEKYRENEIILYKLISEECRESYRNKLVLK